MAFLSLTARLTALAMFVILPNLALAQGGPGGGAPQGPRPAGYMVVTAAEVPVISNLTGRAVAQNKTRIRPRVGGAITAILYQPGSFVTEGTPLFEIDPVNYRATLASAEAEMARAEADLTNARAAFARVERLRESNTSSAAAFETAQATLLKSEATYASAVANLALAKAQMDWTLVRAPISGIVDLPEVSVGDLVTQNQADALTEIVQIDPIQIDLTEPYPLRMAIEARAAAGEITLTDPEVTLALGGGREITQPAKLLATGAMVSATTGTRNLRFELANPDGSIAPGMFLHAKLKLGIEEAVLAPQRATTRERDGSLSAWVVVDGKAEKRILRESGSFGTNWVIQEGLSEGDHLLLDGTSNLREGAEIEAILAEIDDKGVVIDAAVSN